MIRRQSLIALGIALVLGLVAVYLANTFLTTSEKRVEQAQVGLTKVAVAAVPLDYGIDVTPDKVKFVDYPTASLPPGSYSQFAQLVPAGKRRVVLRPMQVNEPILASKLAGEGLGASIAYLLPDGMRAAAVRVNDVSGVAGFVQPSDAVDVLITRQLGDRQATDVLLQNIRVIAIDQNAQGADGKPIVGKTATLEVTPVDSQKLALAQQVGSLSLVLRKAGVEQDFANVRTIGFDDLRYSYYGAVRPTVAAATPRAARPRTAVARAPRPVAPARRSNNVEVVRGTTGSNYEVGGYGS